MKRKSDTYTFDVNESFKSLEVKLTDMVYAVCTKCHKLKPFKEFGLRNMGNGRVRNQAQCNSCRPGR